MYYHTGVVVVGIVMMIRSRHGWGVSTRMYNTVRIEDQRSRYTFTGNVQVSRRY